MKRVILHWTGGTYQPNSVDYEHYHYLITGDGLVVKGKYSPEDNENCNDGKYAQHTGGGNTGSIGIAYCGMYGYKNPDNVGNYPIKPVQLELGLSLIPDILQQYNIKNITPDTVMTHYEFGKKHPKTSSAGKIDITYLPPYSFVEKDDVGNFLRSKVRWYKKRLIINKSSSLGVP